jgi:predicted transcriptional regulator
MAEDKFKQLELLVSQTAGRLRTLQSELSAARQKIRTQEDVIARLKETNAELKTLREWKRNTVNTLRKLEARIEKEINKSAENQNEL